MGRVTAGHRLALAAAATLVAGGLALALTVAGDRGETAEDAARIVFSLVIGWAGALLFSILLVVDVNRTKYAADTMGNAVVITLGIYLDIINLFLSVLRILQGGRR